MEANDFSIKGQIADVVAGRIYSGEIFIKDGLIDRIEEYDHDEARIIAPGLVDAHIHIESSLLVPCEFARMAVVHGTVATVSDPHEIANVTGMQGVEYMLENAAKSPFYFNFGAPSCVPATAFETAGAHLGPEDIEELLDRDDIKYLSEMMNYPGVLFNDPEVMAKITIAHKYGKPVDGHAPGLRGNDVKQYIAAGISTDHECFTLEEALEKIENGMKIIIREGSAARNFDALIPLMKDYPQMLMFCSDDKHPDSLLLGHIDILVRRAIALGHDPIDVLRAATLNPVIHYSLQNGLLQEGDPADFIVANGINDFKVQQTYIKGKKVAEAGKSLLEYSPSPAINQFNCSPIQAADFSVNVDGDKIRVIEVLEGQLITKEYIANAKTIDGKLIQDLDNDILKLVVLNRYKNNIKPAIGFVKNIGLKKGAFASTVAHDSHNIIAVGADDESIVAAINQLVKTKGGLSMAYNKKQLALALPVAGLMSTENGYDIAQEYIKIDNEVKMMGCILAAPFMTLSFLALLVIPEIKLSDKGLFDGKLFKFTNIFTD